MLFVLVLWRPPSTSEFDVLVDNVFNMSKSVANVSDVPVCVVEQFVVMRPGIECNCICHHDVFISNSSGWISTAVFYDLFKLLWYVAFGSGVLVGFVVGVAVVYAKLRNRFWFAKDVLPCHALLSAVFAAANAEIVSNVGVQGFVVVFLSQLRKRKFVGAH